MVQALCPLALVVGCALARPQEAPPGLAVEPGERPAGVEVLEGPLLLHADIAQQWGGHTFTYVVEGEKAVFWTARAAETGPALVGQHPKPGSARPPALTRLELGPDLVRVDPPQLVRTSDGYLHVFAGCARAEGEHQVGQVRYLRSERPEDATSFVDKSERMPKDRFDDFHNRANVGLSRDGSRIVFVNLTNFVPGKHSMNLPLVWIGERDGLDFRFEEPVVYGEATSFFYPQVAATDQGPVLLGAVHREPSRNAELVHLDWEGSVLAWERFPKPEGEVEAWAFDLQPLTEDWSRLAIARLVMPAQGGPNALEFWTYDTRTRVLALARSIPDDVARDRSYASAGKFLLLPGKAPLFVSEPGSSTCLVFEGELLGAGALRASPLPRTRVADFGYPGIRSLFLPNVLTGSIAPVDGVRPLVVDVPGVRNDDAAQDECALLLWWIRRR